ncbi:hypothetical protein [Clostridium perfringens]|nr:hypothetical protein [Clostridium perfringens]MDU2658331.1 hypothetical protein [Clostridium perfringens]MDU2661604.1 hypothetical protein [Clostridioides difficile]MDU7548494.1 hypothetical protein [Clostridium perfringens]VTQ55008.1 Uncharacterised protein [Clostridium perfringens]
MSLINKQTGQTAREILEEMKKKEKDNLKKRKYRLGYEYAFIPKRSFRHKDDAIDSISITILFNIYDKAGNEILFESKGEEFTEQKIKLDDIGEYYLFELLECYIFDKSLFLGEYLYKFFPIPQLLDSEYMLMFKFLKFKKDIILNDGFTKSIEIEEAEFNEIMEINLGIFNNKTRVKSYITQEADDTENIFDKLVIGTTRSGIGAKFSNVGDNNGI